jgi:hypothetical protein
LASLDEIPVQLEDGKLKFSMPGDDAVVKHMILEETPVVTNPVRVEGFPLVSVPLGYELHVSYPTDQEFFSVLKKAQIDREHASLVMISSSIVYGKVYLSFDVTHDYSRVTISGSADESNTQVVLWVKGDATDRRKGEKYTLKKGEVFLMVTVTTLVEQQTGKSASLYVPVDNLNVGHVETLMESLITFTKEKEEKNLKSDDSFNPEIEELVKKAGIHIVPH